MPSTGPRAKHWSFTLNNYTPADVDRLSEPIPGVEYLVFGREVGASGTPHLQGTVSFQSRKRLQQVKAVIGEAHCTVTRHLSQSIDYCKKDGDFTEWGVPQNTGGKSEKKSDLEEFKASVKEGITDMAELRELHSEVCALYPRFVKEYIDDKREKITVEPHPLRQWQQDLNAILLRPPHPRKIIFLVDLTGNTGKTWFSRYFCDLHPESSQIIVPGKKADMAYITIEGMKTYSSTVPEANKEILYNMIFLKR